MIYDTLVAKVVRYVHDVELTGRTGVWSGEIAERFGVELRVASMTLGHCYRRWWLMRWRVGRRYLYALTERGDRFVEWLAAA